ncbi:MAG: nucleoside-diphosphate sugar epimerase/dehydratase, partial [Elusimicrobiota bacterium]|nr:nucleoside-diphosphate sugar epimerase/dehydratase [Elusimicrobiota bacterium]
NFSQKMRKTIIIGAGDAGVLTLKECQNNPAMDLDVVGFIDDDTTKRGHSIYGVKVFGGRKKIPDIVASLEVEEIIIAIPSVKGDAIRDILFYCEQTDARIKIIPGLDKILSGHLEVKPRAVKPEDLLGRETVEIDEMEIISYIKGKRILVTGAGGSIGSELCRQISRFFPERIIFFDNHENYVYYLGVEFSTKFRHIKYNTIIGDIKDINTLRHIFSQYKPHVVFHAAAHKHVPLMEENLAAAIKNNVIGSRNLIYASSHYKAERFVLISSDKAVNPTSIMGATKRIAEKILQAKAKTSKTKFMAVRFGNVLGSSGSVIPLFKKQIEEGGPVTVTHPEVKRYFMSIPEATRLVLQASAIGLGGEIFVLDMGEQIKIIDIAKNLIALSGLKLEKDIKIEFIGLRPGEKLYEEILLNTEENKVTKHNKIYVAKPGDYDSAKIRKDIRTLESLANVNNNKGIIEKIKEMVPNYKPEIN